MIFLAGASGFVGERVLGDLLRAGHDVTAHVHSDTSRRMIEARYPDLRIVQADLSNVDQVRGIITDGTDTAIWLPGILRETNRQTFEQVHVTGVQNLLHDAKRGGVTRWIQMSALGVGPDKNQIYFETKWRAEKIIRSSGLAWTILRPSLIFDDRPRLQHDFVKEIAKAIGMAPFVPILGKGKFLLQPVSVDDVSQTIVQSLAKPETVGKTYELGGPEALTYTEIVTRIARAMASRKPKVHIPIGIMLLAARLLDWIPAFPITSQELHMLTAGNYIKDVAREREWRNTFNLPMKSFQPVL